MYVAGAGRGANSSSFNSFLVRDSFAIPPKMILFISRRLLLTKRDLLDGFTKLDSISIIRKGHRFEDARTEWLMSISWFKVSDLAFRLISSHLKGSCHRYSYGMLCIIMSIAVLQGTIDTAIIESVNCDITDK